MALKKVTKTTIEKINDLRKSYSKKEITQQEYHVGMEKLKSELKPHEVIYEQGKEELQRKRRKNEVNMIQYREEMKVLLNDLRKAEEPPLSEQLDMNEIMKAMKGQSPEDMKEVTDLLEGASKMIKMATGEIPMDNDLVTEMFLKAFNNYLDDHQMILPFNVLRIEIAHDSPVGMITVACKLCWEEEVIEIEDQSKIEMSVLIINLMIKFIEQHLEQDHVGEQ